MSSRQPISVYVSGKMTAPTVRGWNANIKHGERVAWALMEEGYVVFSPHLGAHLNHCDGYPDWDWERWLRYDEDVIRTVDVVYMMDNYADSKGALRELAFAKRLGVPVAYSHEELHAIARDIRKQRRAVA